MNRNITYLLLVFALFFVLPNTYAQNDTIKKKKNNEFKSILDGRTGADGIQLGKEIEINPIFRLNQKAQLPLKGFDYYLNLGRSKSKSDLRSLASNAVHDDVLVKRYFNGKDMSVTKVESHTSLGTFEGSTKFVRIEFRDHGLVDGDRVRIYLNEKVVEPNITLVGISAFIELKMDKGYNRIDFSALNQGAVGPNTAAFLVYDDQGKLITAQAWNLRTSQNATLGIIRN
ncbi:MAG: hypothetical protein QNJ57_13745 [Flavobacteriaceae bacterium]|nr:hypothetical protein [Flavobacteriaceae bacterium]